MMSLSVLSCPSINLDTVLVCKYNSIDASSFPRSLHQSLQEQGKNYLPWRENQTQIFIFLLVLGSIHLMRSSSFITCKTK